MLLIYPPSARSCEAPIGIARLASFLRTSGREVQCLDLCLEGIEYLLGLECRAEDKRTRGALARRDRAAQSLRDKALYSAPGRYARAVSDLGWALRRASAPSGAEASLADYRDEKRSPLLMSDLIAAARDFSDNIFYPLFERRAGAAADAQADGWVGISICYLSQALCAFALIGYLRATRPHIRIAVGGGLVTSWMATGRIDASERFSGLVDSVLSGPGEEALGSIFGIEGLGAAGSLDLDDFARNSYLAPSRIVPYNFSFGCPWKRCSFCLEKTENLPYRGIPVAKARAELRRLSARYAPGLFHFTDSEISPLYLRGLAENPPGAPWYGFARFSRILLDPGFCRALSEAGCAMLQLGLESGDQRVLDELGKGTKVEEIERILENLRAASIGTYIYVLFGTPAEDEASAMRSRDFIAAHADAIDFLNVAVFNLPAAGAEAKELETRNFYEGELSLYSEFRHPKGWNRAEVRKFLERDFGSQPGIQAVLARTPPVFTSSHAVFFLPRRSWLEESI